LLEMLFKHLSSSSAEQRDIVERGILVLAKSPPDALAKLQVLQKSEDSDLRRRALSSSVRSGFREMRFLILLLKHCMILRFRYVVKRSRRWVSRQAVMNK
ncbi:MAG TPA: hypothetical protein PLP17_12845, partial [Oligoflexia bacterium]|nr:hypothetical protein [Oligoflexia bacterium]